MGYFRTTTFCIYLISSIVAGCVPIPVPLLPGDGIYNVEIQIDKLIESKATKTDVIGELGVSVKYRALSMSYKACREGGGVGLLLVPMGGMGVHYDEFRGDALCVELLLQFDNSNRLMSYKEIPWEGDVDFAEEDMNLMRMADNGDTIAKHLWETSSNYMHSVKYENELIKRINHGDNTPYPVWKLYLLRGRKPKDIQLLCQAADGGIIDAQLMLAWSFRIGNGVQRSSERAYMWYKLASINNYSEHSNLDMPSRLRTGYELTYLKKSMTDREILNAEQLLNNWKLGQCENELLINDDKQQTKALEETIINAQQGNPAAMYSVYLSMDSDLSHPRTAWIWLCKAADLGYTRAQIEISRWYVTDSWQYEQLKRLEWLREAGVHPDDKIAYMWYTLAANNDEDMLHDRNKIFNEFLTKEDIQEAENMVRDWRPGQCLNDLEIIAPD